MPWLAYKHAMNPAVYVGLFMLGAAIAAALPRPLQEDRRASNEFRRQKHKTVSSSSAVVCSTVGCHWCTHCPPSEMEPLTGARRLGSSIG